MSLRGTLAASGIQQPSAVTIGVFDGVHRGHQALVRACVERGRAAGLLPVVITFDPHPQRVLNPDREMARIAPLADRLARLATLGAAEVIVLPFDSALASTSADEFARALVEELQMRLLVVGPDFVFGHGRQGTAEYLSARGDPLGFAVVVVPRVADHDGRRVSSTAVRAAVLAGDMRLAAQLLGHRFTVSGRVVEGDRRGRLLGFPTANVAVPDDALVPANGIYACRAHFDDAEHDAVTSIGVRPTFGEGRPRWIEVFVLDFSGDLYARELRISFIERLRGEERFDSAEALVQQMERDVANARAVLTHS